MRRKIYDKLLEWKSTSNGQSALLVEGARRVGKSYIVEEFAKNEYTSYALIDFSHAPKELFDLFENDSYDIPLLLEKLRYILRVDLRERESLIILDEVQLCPKARQAIKHLVADGRYDYIETGSLLSIKENVKDIVIPSEEESIRMYPMDFEEFCWALGDTVTVPNIRRHFEERTPMGTDIHKVTLRLFRHYMLVGGMPKAVSTYVDTRNFKAVEAEKRRILDLYRKDIRKKGGITENVFLQMPSELNKHERTFTLNSADKFGRMDRFNEPFFWLEDSMIANLCYNSVEPNLGLSMNRDRTTLKCYMGDTGLLITMSISDGTLMENEVYLSLLDDKLHINEGMLTENMVAQMLRANGHDLYFHSFYDRDKNNNRYEIDFLIREGRKISPIEVKSSITTKHRSLDLLMARHSKTLGQAYILNLRDVKKEGNILYLPIYMAICL